MFGTYGYVETVTRKLKAHASSGVHETFAVTVRWPRWARSVPAFFKAPYPHEQNKFIFNELLANRLALALGLPVVETCPCACRKRLLRESGAKASVLSREKADYIAGVASLDANPHLLKQRLFPGPKTENELLRWRFCADVAVFDELIYNKDRTLQNLVRLGQYNFQIIDHDAALSGPEWTLEALVDLLTRPTHCNHLADLIVGSQDQVSTRRMMKTAEGWARGFRIPMEISNELAVQARMDHGLVVQVLELLDRRVKLLPELLRVYVCRQQLELSQLDD